MQMSLDDLVSTYEKLIEDINCFNRNIYGLSDEEHDEFLLETARTSDHYEGTLTTLGDDVAQIDGQLKILSGIDPDVDVREETMRELQEVFS